MLTTVNGDLKHFCLLKSINFSEMKGTMLKHEVQFVKTSSPKKKLLWLTDLHLDAADVALTGEFLNKLKSYEPSALLIGGDISNGYGSLLRLKEIASKIGCEVYFVLGNHDYYYGSISNIRKMAMLLVQEIPVLHFLTQSNVIELTSETALIGHDGWSDARQGDFLHSTVVLNDYFLIDELKELTPLERLRKLNALGTESAKHLEKVLRTALESYSRIVLLTHVPPFIEACWTEGKMSDDNWAPHFVNKTTGEVLKNIMEAHPDQELLVLCGHSHEFADVHVLPNIRVLTGESKLGVPSVQGVIEID